MTTNQDISLIDRAEVLVGELQQIMLQLDGLNRLNLGVNLDHIARLAEVRDDLIPGILADYSLLIGEGHRVMDRPDRKDD
jgi:hypothetical protein